MSYALFEHDTELSRGFASYEAALQHAEDAGLTKKTHQKPALVDGYRILEIDEMTVDDETAEDRSLPPPVN
jgi:hypothetical protein